MVWSQRLGFFSKWGKKSNKKTAKEQLSVQHLFGGQNTQHTNMFHQHRVKLVLQFTKFILHNFLSLQIWSFSIFWWGFLNNFYLGKNEFLPWLKWISPKVQKSGLTDSINQIKQRRLLNFRKTVVFFFFFFFFFCERETVVSNLTN